MGDAHLVLGLAVDEQRAPEDGHGEDMGVLVVELAVGVARLRLADHQRPEHGLGLRGPCGRAEMVT